MVDRLGCLINRQLHGTKLLHSCGAFGDYFSQKILDKVDQSLVLGNEHTQGGVPCMYEKSRLTFLNQFLMLLITGKAKIILSLAVRLL
jgi:hypothetical protein